MSAHQSFIDYLDDMLDAIEKAKAFISGMNFDEFKNDDKTVYAVIRALEILGEASNKIPRSIQRNYPQIPWKEVNGMRNKLIHNYMGVNKKVVWKTTKEDLSHLEKIARQMKKDFTSSK
jgi:uncharacterized protein with HEPN domain